MEYRRINPHDLRFKINRDLEYADNLFLFLEAVPVGGIVKISEVSSNPGLFIETVKSLISDWCIVRDIEFSDNFEFIRKVEFETSPKVVLRNKFYS